MCMKIIAQREGPTDRETGVTDCPIVFIGKCQGSPLSLSITLQNNMLCLVQLCNYAFIISSDLYLLKGNSLFFSLPRHHNQKKKRKIKLVQYKLEVEFL